MIPFITYSVGYIIAACCFAIVRPLAFRAFDWNRNDENEGIWTVGSIFWPLLISILVIMVPVRAVENLRGRFEYYLEDRSQLKLLKAEEAKRLPMPKPVGYKEVFYREMDCKHCGHAISVD